MRSSTARAGGGKVAIVGGDKADPPGPQHQGRGGAQMSRRRRLVRLGQLRAEIASHGRPERFAISTSGCCRWRGRDNEAALEPRQPGAECWQPA
jgi:hypothetical protein